jgi:hypothetical protein
MSNINIDRISLTASGDTLVFPVRELFATARDEIIDLQAAVQTLAARSQAAASIASANPTGTPSDSYVMMGIAMTFTAPPGASRALIIVTGETGSTANNGETFVSICYGVGPPPVNPAPLTGTQIGNPIHAIASTGGGDYTPFSQNALLTDLTPDTYWIDLAVKAAGGGVASVANLQITGVSILDPVTL